MGKSLVAFDTDRIKGYVFGTSKLKEIRGASALLDRLNREEMPGLVDGACIYANGGAGLFEVDTDHANRYIQAVTRAYRQATGAAGITGAAVEIPNDSADLGPALNLLRHRLRVTKRSKTGALLPLTHPLMHFCDSCGSGCAQVTTEEGELLCDNCAKKRTEDSQVKEDIDAWAAGRRPVNANRLWGRLIERLMASGQYPVEGYERPNDFDTLGQASSPTGYLGLIYADGDSMGQQLEGITDLARLQQFAHAVDDAIYQSVQEGVERYLRPEEGECWPFDILLLGGDDLVMVTRAQSAVQMALYVVERFPEITRQTWGAALNLSASVVLLHANHPISSALSLAESGLKFAKRQGTRRAQLGENLSGGLLSFLVVNSANHLDFGEYYRQTLKADQLTGTTLYRTQRPYTAEEMRRLLAQVNRAQSIPRTKLEYLRQAVFKSRRQGTLDAMMAVLRMRNQCQREALLELVGTSAEQQLYFPWIQRGDDWTTPLLDIVELLDFVPQGATG